jgi:hypothetical protein
MSDKVIQFPGKKDEPDEIDVEDGHHLAGSARCMKCKYEWQAVTPVGHIESLECPECHLHFGVMIFPTMPEAFWTCGHCECHIFSVSGISKEILCWQCGSIQVWGDDT